MLVLASSQPVVSSEPAPVSSNNDPVMNHSTPKVLQALQRARLQTGQPGAPQLGVQGKQELKLEDIHPAPKPPAWPPAPGWWIVFFLLLALLTFTVLKLLRYWKLKKQQKAILRTLDKLENTLNQEQSTEAIANINILLRRLALAYYPRKQIASLTGKDWLVFLDRSGDTNAFTQGAGKLLAEAPYLPSMPQSTTMNSDIKALATVVKKWVKRIAAQKQGRAYE